MYYERYFDEEFKEARNYWNEHNLGDVNEQIDIMLGKRKGN